MIFRNTKTKVLMWVPNVLKFLIRTRINIIVFDNIVGIDRVGIMWIGIDSVGNLNFKNFNLLTYSILMLVVNWDKK